MEKINENTSIQGFESLTKNVGTQHAIFDDYFYNNVMGMKAPHNR